MTAATTPILRVENLTKCYGATCILKGASLTLGKGEIKVLIGPSGGGKSTLLQCLNCLVQPDSGEIWLDGVRIDLQSKPDLYRRGRAILAAMVAGANLLYVQYYRSVAALDRGDLSRE